MCSVCLYVWFGGTQSLGIEQSEGLGEEIVTQSGFKGPNASVTFARQQEG